MTKTLHCLIVACLLIFIVGCGPRGGLRVEFVEGIVTFDGVPVSEASVSFIPLDQEEGAGGFTDANGRYTLSSFNGEAGRGAVAGDYAVTVSQIEIYTITEGDPERGGIGLTGQRHLLPERYRDRENTPLRVTVNRGRNTINLELTRSP
jgi:hypothetical protein